jgi:hypothetical protein
MLEQQQAIAYKVAFPHEFYSFVQDIRRFIGHTLNYPQYSKLSYVLTLK